MQDGSGIPPTTITLADRVRQAALTRAGKPALLWRDRTITWAELDAEVDRVAVALRGQLTRTGSGGYPPRVAIALLNSPDFAVAFFATLRAGLVAVPVNPGCTAPELAHLLADSAADILLATDRVAELAATLAAELPRPPAVHTGLPSVSESARPVVAGAGSGTGQETGGEDCARSPDPEDLAVLLYTSGTEGRPKGAMLTHRALLANHEQLDRLSPPVLGPQDRVLLALPLFHAYGLNTGLGAVAYHGACGLLVERFEAAETAELTARHQLTALVGVPSMYQEWVALADQAGAELSSVRLAVCGAAPLDPSVAARFTELTGCQIAIGYGLTETAPVLTSTLASPVAKSGSIGRALPGVELRLISAEGADIWRDGSGGPDEDPDEFDVDLPSSGSDPGQIVARGPNLFNGYWPQRAGGPDAEGWWATGDIAYADADGDLFLVDRLGELILVNGFNVYPREVELVLQDHPGVAEVAVLGVPDARTGEAVKAYVVPVAGHPVEVADLRRHCERQLARFKCPTSVEFVEALPYSLIGKVRKTELRAGERR